jgi:hypothetical protein
MHGQSGKSYALLHLPPNLMLFPMHADCSVFVFSITEAHHQHQVLGEQALGAGR